MSEKRTKHYESPRAKFVACKTQDIFTASNGFRGAWDELPKIG